MTKVETRELGSWPSAATRPENWSGFTVFRILETQYDAMGRKTRDTLERANGTVETVTQYSYDAIGRLDCTAVRMNPAIFAALPASACTAGTAGSDGPDRITRTLYDAAGQRLQLREGVGSAIEGTEATWAYNANGQVTTVIDGNGNRATLQYDGHGRQTGWTFPSTTRASAFDDSTPALALSTSGSVGSLYEAYGYDPNGNRTNLLRRDGRNIAFAYDALNRVTAKTYPQGGATAVYYGYDLRGLQTFARFTSSTGDGITNTYDGFGRLTSTSSNMGGNTRALAYQYDTNGNRTRITHPDSNYFNTTYDGLNRPLLLQANASTTIAATEYYAHGGLWVINRMGQATEINYDNVQRPYVLHHYLPTAGDVYWVSTFNPASQIASTVRTNDAYAWTGHYATTRAYTTDGLNQYSAATGISFGYDANGNLTASGSNNYVYDIENRMVGAPGNIALTYDPLGRLFQVANTSSGAATQFLYDGDAMVAEYNGANLLLRRHVHNVGADVPMATYAVTGGTGLGTISQLFADRQGSIVAQLTSGGVNTGLNTYDEYGIPGSGNSGRFQYTGQIWLSEIGMYHYKARIYSPYLGRFMQTDPIGYQDQINLYAYVGNDAINQTDPSGLGPLIGNTDEDRMAAQEINGLRENPHATYSHELREGTTLSMSRDADRVSGSITQSIEGISMSVTFRGQFVDIPGKNGVAIAGLTFSSPSGTRVTSSPGLITIGNRSDGRIWVQSDRPMVIKDSVTGLITLVRQPAINQKLTRDPPPPNRRRENRRRSNED